MPARSCSDQLAGKGSKVDKTTPLATIHAADEASFLRAQEMVKHAYNLGAAPAPLPPVLERIA